MDLITIIRNMEKEAFIDKDLYLVSHIKFENGSYSITGQADASALSLNPSPVLIQFIEEVGEKRIHLLVALTDWNDDKKVAEVIILRRAPKNACIPIRFFRNNKEEAKSIDNIVGFSHSKILGRDLLIEHLEGEVPDDWTITPTGCVTVRAKNGKKQFRIIDTSLVSHTATITFSSNLTDEIVNVHCFATAGQTNKAFGFGVFDSSSNQIPIIFNADGHIYLHSFTAGVDLGGYNAEEEYHFRLEFNQTAQTVSAWVNGVKEATDWDYSTQMPNPIRGWAFGTSSLIEQATFWIRSPTIWTETESGNEEDEYFIIGLKGSIARFMAIYLLKSDECYITLNQLHYCTLPSKAWDYPLSLLAKVVNQPRESGESDIRLRRRLKPFYELWAATIPKLYSVIADLADLSDPTVIKIEEYNPHYWGVFLPIVGLGEEAVWDALTDAAKWQAFLDKVKPIATNVVYGSYALIRDLSPYSPTDSFFVGTRLPDFADVFAPMHGHSRLEHGLDLVHGEGRDGIVNTQVV